MSFLFLYFEDSMQGWVIFSGFVVFIIAEFWGVCFWVEFWRGKVGILEGGFPVRIVVWDFKRTAGRWLGRFLFEER